MISTKLWQGFSIARSGVYFLEALPIMAYNRFAHPDIPPPTPDQLKILWRNIYKIHQREAGNIERGIYPWQVLDLEKPWTHIRSFTEVMRDGVKVAWRMRQNKTKDFKAEHAENMPDYYSRNFHFQTDGYFSESSARRYDHQVEILFNGTAGAMRRLILPPMHEHLRKNARILELGCGSGSATRMVATTFPKARLTALDLSAPYLKVAQDNLRAHSKVDFSQGDATQLEYKDQMFDCVYCVYVMHELPAEERKKMLGEAWRVLKPGGLLVVADSLQWDDDPELNWALERFPKIYHEPFYKNYINSSLEKLLTEVSVRPAESTHALFTKVAWVIKP